MPNKNEYDSLTAKITWDERGFFLFFLKNTNAIYDLEEAKSQFEYFIAQTNGAPYKVLMDSRESLVFPTDDAFEYFFEHNKEENFTAIIATSLPMQLLMGQMMKGNEIKNTKLFKNEDDAIEWLLNT